MWAVIGMPSSDSLMLAAGMPSRASAAARAASWATGSQVGLGCPWPWVEAMRVPNGPFLVNRRRLLSIDCITSRITDFSDQWCTDSERTKSMGWRSAVATKRRGWGRRPSPFTRIEAMSPMKLLPGG